MSYTPGPWKRQGREIHTSAGVFYIAYFTEKGTNKPSFVNYTELDENVKLIASAPDLLAALKQTLELAVNYACESRKCNPEECETWPWVQRARAAIARAEGK